MNGADSAESQLAPRLEAVLMTADRPMSDARLAEVLDLPKPDDEEESKGPSIRQQLSDAIDSLNGEIRSHQQDLPNFKGGWRVAGTDQPRILRRYHQAQGRKAIGPTEPGGDGKHWQSSPTSSPSFAQTSNQFVEWPAERCCAASWNGGW